MWQANKAKTLRQTSYCSSDLAKSERERNEMSVETGTPTEILCEIFYFLCNEPVYLDVLFNSTAQDFPWAVGQVCRRWRDVFISYPPLWISLSLQPRRRASAAYLAEMNRRTIIYLERSGQLPLTVCISLSYDFSDTPVPAMVLGTLVSCSTRWKNLTLTIDSQSKMDFFQECKGKSRFSLI